MPHLSVRSPASGVQSPYTRKRSLLHTVALEALRREGLPHPGKDGFLMLPKWFSTILACEPHTVAQVILEVLEQTVGYVGDGPDNRRAWAPLSYRHFERKGLMGRDAARHALVCAVKAGYLVTRPGKRRSQEYAVRWKALDFVTREGCGQCFDCRHYHRQ
jgi:hypothetical protein